MKKLIATLPILIAFSLVQAQTSDWPITLGRLADEGSAGRIDPKGNSYSNGRFASSPFARTRLNAASSFAAEKQVMLEAKLSLRSVGRTRKVALIRNARKNGYTTRQERNAIYFQAIGVEDPITKKPLEGLKVLEYRCQTNEYTSRVNLQMETGSSQMARLACTVMVIVDPQILLLDEPGPGSN